MRITDYETFMQDDEKKGYGSSTMEYGYFSLKDGETATVRIMLDDVRDFDLELLHYVDIDGKQRKISCLGNDCPLCRAGIAQTKRMFIPMIQYSNNGATQTPVVWERNKDYAKLLKGYMNDYGPLSDILCNITRMGTGLDTNYTISPNVKAREAVNYPKVAFPDVEPSKYCVSNKSAEDMNVFIETGKFPEGNRNTNNSSNATVGSMGQTVEQFTPIQDAVPEIPFESAQVVQQTPVMLQVAPTPQPTYTAPTQPVNQQYTQPNNYYTNPVSGRPQRY